MKKLFALLLIIGCIFACVSCGDDTGAQTGVTLDTFASAVAASNPTGAVINIKVSTELGDLENKYVVTYNQDGTVTVGFTEQEFVPFDPANPLADTKKTEVGTVTIQADGTYDGAISGTAADIAAGIALDVTKLSGATVTEAGVLTATVAAANTQSALGVSIASDVNVKLCIYDGVVERIEMSYANTAITCVYQK